MKAIRFRITPELLKQSLQLPENTIVRGLYEDPESPDLIWWIVLEGDDFPEVAEGARPTEAMVTVTKDLVALGHMNQFDWGLDVSDS